MASRLRSREESWDNVEQSEGFDEESPSSGEVYSDVIMEDQSSEESDDVRSPSPSIRTVRDVQRAIHPLQATADRVGRQVELFAENLDRLSQRTQKGPQKDCRDVLPTVNAFRKIAGDTVDSLRSIHFPEKQKLLSRSLRSRTRTSSGRSTPGITPSDHGEKQDSQTTLKDLQRWEEEEQTWKLLGLMLQVEYPVPAAVAEGSDIEGYHQRPASHDEVHPYSSERDVWNHYLSEHNDAWERHTVVEWLKGCADTSGQDIEVMIKDLEYGADRGSGLWAHSWLYTKEALKNQKRLRSWPQPLEPNSPGIDASLRTVDKSKSLVTQLDPDAITRQERSLETQDHYFERATWLACWEMIRRGKDWSYIREWCQERVEFWRAAAVRGDPRDLSNSDSISNSSWRTRALWRKTCALAAKQGGIDKYENAIYGILSGYLPSTLAVCDSWNDNLFAHYNSYLLVNFDKYLRQDFPDRVPQALAQQHATLHFKTSAGNRPYSGAQLVERMKRTEPTAKEAATPIKMLQGSLIAKSFDDFIVKQGVRLAQSANRRQKSKTILSMDSNLLEGTITANITIEDYDMLRILTHMLLIFQDMNIKIEGPDKRAAADNIVVAYMDFLGKAGKYQLLPLYAARLLPERAVNSLGRQLPLIHEHGERRIMMKLMEGFGIDVPAVLMTQLKLIILDAPPNPKSDTAFTSLVILEPTGKDMDRIRPIRQDFIGIDITDDENDLIRGFEWYLLLDGHWRQTMNMGAALYKHFLRSRGLAAGRKLSQTITFSNLSLSKTNKLLGKAIDLDLDGAEAYSDVEYDEDAGEDVVHPRQQRQILLKQAESFRDFQSLFAVLNAIEEWRNLAGQVYDFANLRVTKPKPNADWRRGFDAAVQSVESAIAPMIQGWLQNPRDDKEGGLFKDIRIACLPELLLAYIEVLNFSARFLSRDYCLRVMDLAADIAAEGSELTECFMAAGRMTELVTTLAYASQGVISADEKGHKAAKARSKMDGKSLDIWSPKVVLGQQ